MNEKNNQDSQNWQALRNNHSSEELQELWDLSGKFGQAYEPDVESGLQRLHERLAAEKTGPRRIMLGRRRHWLRIAAAIIALALVGGWWYQQQRTPTVEWTVVATAGGEQRELVLPDGSEVILNEHSRLSYRNDLATAAERELQLRGEAYFDVQRAPEQPFHIRSSGVDVSVLGTAFNLRVPADGQSAELAVTHGRVAFKPHTVSQSLLVEKGEVATWQDGQAPLLQPAQPTDNYRAWHSRSLQFNDTPLAEVLELLARTYRIEFDQIQPAGASDCRLTGHWDQLSAGEAMNLLALLTGLDVKATGPGTYQLSGTCEG